MDWAGKIASNAVIVLVVFVVVGIYNQDISQNRIFEQISIFVPSAVGIGLFIWYITSQNDRSNRKYTRERIAQTYLDCIAILNGLIINADKISYDDVIKEIEEVRKKHNGIVKRAWAHSHLLNPSELDGFMNEQEIIKRYGILDTTGQHDHEVPALRSIFRKILSDYIIKYKLQKFKEHRV